MYGRGGAAGDALTMSWRGCGIEERQDERDMETWQEEKVVLRRLEHGLCGGGREKKEVGCAEERATETRAGARQIHRYVARRSKQPRPVRAPTSTERRVPTTTCTSMTG